jgi:cytochrome c553
LNNDLADLNLYVISPDRKTLHRLLNHKDIDMHPKLLNDGRIAYLRWEYQERYFMETHSVWTVRQDGCGADALFKQHLPLPYSVRLAISLGDTKKLLAIAAGHHTLPQGALVILDPSVGISNPAGIKVVTQGINVNEGNVPYPSVDEGGRTDAGGFYTDPYSLDNQSFLVSYAFSSPTAKRYNWYKSDADSNGYGVYVVDVFGNKELLYRDPFLGVYNAMPLKKRAKPPVLANTIDRSKNYAVCSIPNVQEGMEGVAAGTVKYIRILEALPWKVVQGEGVKRWSPIYTWDDKNATRWCPVRVIGEVPVEGDGSAHFKVPATDGASVYFEALDEHKQEVRRMRSSVSFAAGEVRSCSGCHESNSTAVNAAKNVNGFAMRREPSEPIPPTWGSQTPIHFPRDVQPLLTKNCVSCHSGKDAKAGLDFSENIALRTIRDKKLVERSDARNNSEISKPYQFGSAVSKLTQAISPFKRDNAKLSLACPFELSSAEYEVLALWVDANIPYTGEMLHKRTKDGKQNVWLPFNWQNPWLTPINQPALSKQDIP